MALWAALLFARQDVKEGEADRGGQYKLLWCLPRWCKGAKQWLGIKQRSCDQGRVSEAQEGGLCLHPYPGGVDQVSASGQGCVCSFVSTSG